MAEYHIGNGIAGIYAGILDKTGKAWKAKSDVTEEAIRAAFVHLVEEIPENATQYMITYPSSEYELIVRKKEGLPWVKDKYTSNFLCPVCGQMVSSNGYGGCDYELCPYCGTKTKEVTR